jgi:hypothetical protein
MRGMVGNLRRLAYAGLLGWGIVAALPVWGAALTPKQTVEVLARATAANSKCQILTEAESRILAALLRQAERKLVTSADLTKAAATISKAQQLGGSVRCDQTTRTAVKAVMTAAHEAAFGAIPELRGANIEPAPLEVSTDAIAREEGALGEDEVATATQLEPAVSSAKPVSKPKATMQKPPVQKSVMQRKTRDKRTTGQLAAYEAIAERYYRERRCGNMSKSAINALYSRVISSHRQAVANFGARTVRMYLRRAEAKASGRGC